MARENYKFAARKRELDKKRKKEEKAQRKAAERAARPAGGDQIAEAQDPMADAAAAEAPADPEPNA